MAKITKEMIARILAHVGGAANVAQAGNCMTRLRLTLRDESLADSAAIRQIDGVMGVIVSDEQFQVVLGPGKAQTAAEMMNGLLEAAPAAAPVAVSAPAAPAEPALLVVGRDGDPFLGEVREAVLSTLEYPREARRMRRQGTVTVQFVIGPDGRVSGISVHEGSGHDMLDREACAAVARAVSLWGSPGRTVRIRMPVVFTLKKGRG